MVLSAGVEWGARGRATLFAASGIGGCDGDERPVSEPLSRTIMLNDRRGRASLLRQS